MLSFSLSHSIRYCSSFSLRPEFICKFKFWAIVVASLRSRTCAALWRSSSSPSWCSSIYFMTSVRLAASTPMLNLSLAKCLVISQSYSLKAFLWSAKRLWCGNELVPVKIAFRVPFTSCAGSLFLNRFLILEMLEPMLAILRPLRLPDLAF